MVRFSLQGSITALVTPFTTDGAIDFDAFDRLIDMQIEGGTSGIVVCGSTGETPTLSEEEDAALIRHAVEYVNHRIAVVAGTGSNSTESCIKYTRNAMAAGVDAVLVVVPYYNKPTATGLYNHFATVAKSVDIPIIIYNVPSRTGICMPVDIVLRLARDFDNIVGIKEATGNILNTAALVAGRPEGFRIYSGDDNISMSCNLLGADGCVSVLANIVPADFAKLMKLSIEGNAKEACDVYYRYRRLMDLLFIDSNPIPVKAALAAMGLVNEIYRSPLCVMEEAHKQLLLDELKKLDIVR